jgi:predicted DsbA family dithiol-disulfide isomerase
MPAQLEIDFISDVACPWCAIGLASLEEALRRVGDAVTAAIRFQPFELNPDMRATGENIDEFLGGRYGANPAQLEVMRESLRARAASIGFHFNQHARGRIYNTFDAHRLLRWAQDTGKQRALKHSLFKANFGSNADVSDPEVLVSAAVAAGLDAGEARDVLMTGRYADDVRRAEQLWLSRGIHAVPAIVINGQWLIAGAQPVESIEKTLQQIAAGGSPALR